MVSAYKDELQRKIRAAVGPIFESLPESYPERFSWLTAARNAFHEELASALEPSLNSYLTQQKSEQYSDRENTAALINNDLWMLGLAIRGPKDRSAILKIDRPDQSSREASLVRLVVGDRRVRLPGSPSWPELELMRRPPDARDHIRYFRGRN